MKLLNIALHFGLSRRFVCPCHRNLSYSGMPFDISPCLIPHTGLLWRTFPAYSCTIQSSLFPPTLLPIPYHIPWLTITYLPWLTVHHSILSSSTLLYATLSKPTLTFLALLYNSFPSLPYPTLFFPSYPNLSYVTPLYSFLLYLTLPDSPILCYAILSFAIPSPITQLYLTLAYLSPNLSYPNLLYPILV